MAVWKSRDGRVLVDMCKFSPLYSPNCLICLCFSCHKPSPPPKKEKKNPSCQKLAFRQNNGCQLYDHIKKLVKANFLITK